MSLIEQLDAACAFIHEVCVAPPSRGNDRVHHLSTRCDEATSLFRIALRLSTNARGYYFSQFCCSLQAEEPLIRRLSPRFKECARINLAAGELSKALLEHAQQWASVALSPGGNVLGSDATDDVALLLAQGRCLQKCC